MNRLTFPALAGAIAGMLATKSAADSAEVARTHVTSKVWKVSGFSTLALAFVILV
jgi:hypothetical protein